MGDREGRMFRAEETLTHDRSNSRQPHLSLEGKSGQYGKKCTCQTRHRVLDSQCRGWICHELFGFWHLREHNILHVGSADGATPVGPGHVSVAIQGRIVVVISRVAVDNERIFLCRLRD